MVANLKQVLSILIVSIFLTGSLVAQDDPPTAETSERIAAFQNIRDEWDESYAAFWKELGATKPGPDRDKLLAGAPRRRDFVARAMELVDEVPDDAAAAKVLAWCLSNGEDTLVVKRCKELIVKHHSNSEAMGALCLRLSSRLSKSTFESLENTLSTATLPLVRANARQAIVIQLRKWIASVRYINSLKSDRQIENYEKRAGAEHVTWIRSLREKDLQTRLESELETLIENHPGNIAKWAESTLYEVRYVSVGKTAVETSGKDSDDKAFKLSDYRGKVVVLYFWGST